MKIIIILIILAMSSDTYVCAELHDINPIVSADQIFPWWIIAVIGIGVGVALVWLFLRSNNTRMVVPMSATEQVLKELSQIEGSADTSTEQCFKLSRTLKFYLEKTYMFNACEQTAPELIHTINQRQLFNNDLRERVINFITYADVVKFSPVSEQQDIDIGQYIGLIKEVIQGSHDVND